MSTFRCCQAWGGWRLGWQLTIIRMPFLLNECGSKEACREEYQGQNRKDDGDNKESVCDTLAVHEVGNHARRRRRRGQDAAVWRTHAEGSLVPDNPRTER